MFNKENLLKELENYREFLRQETLNKNNSEEYKIKCLEQLRITTDYIKTLNNL